MNQPTADYVLHKPTGEEWVVCGVNYERGELIPCGYPFPSVAKIEDCVLTEKKYSSGAQEREYIEALQKAGMTELLEAQT